MTTGTPVARRTRDRRWWLAAAIGTVSVIVLAVAAGGHRRHDPAFDIFDESAHYSYVMALRSGHLPAWGDQLTVAERKLVACLRAPIGDHLIPQSPVACGAQPRSASLYAAMGYDYEAQQPPLGYLPYVLTAAPQPNPQRSIAAARHGGVAWVVLSGAALLLFGAMEELSLVALLALLCTSLLAPAFTYAAATVNNDAAGVALGAVGLIAWSLSRHRPRLSLWAGLLAGVLLGLTKGTLVLVPVALVVASVAEDRQLLRATAGLGQVVRRALCPLAMLLATVVAFTGWTSLQSARAKVAASVVYQHLFSGHIHSLLPSSIGEGVISGLSVFRPYSASASLNVVWGVAAFGILIAVVCLPRTSLLDDGRAQALALGIAGSLVLLAVGWTVYWFMQYHYDDIAQARYFIPLLPLVGYGLVTACRRAGLLTVGVALPVAAVAVQLWNGFT